MISCPICSSELKHHIVNKVEIDVCAEHGTWLDKSELLSITEAKRHEDPAFMWADLFRVEQRPGTHVDRALNCPQCLEEMVVEMYEGVHIDWCREHGVWLDNGELSAILNNLRLNPLFVGQVALRLWEDRY